MSTQNDVELELRGGPGDNSEAIDSRHRPAQNISTAESLTDQSVQASKRQ
jgi:hypothetical protein